MSLTSDAIIRPALFTALLLRGAVALVTCLLLLMPTKTPAAEPAQIEAFLKVTGFDVALQSIAQSAGEAPQMLGVEAGDFGLEWERLAEDVFDPEIMHDMALDILQQTLSSEALFHAAEFYASDLGQRLVEVENAAQLGDGGSDRAEGDRLIAQMAARDDPKIGIFQDMNRAIGGTDGAVRAVQEIQVRFLMAASAAGIIELQIDIEGLRALMKEQEAEMHRAMAASNLAHSAVTYQGFSEQDMRAYVAALKHPLMREVYELLNAVQFEIQANRFEELAHRMRDLQPVQDL
ncbi:DUF2059 domain-containing protein [Phaeobacter sp. B1627]|uniref:DUF2059 domain-containing protein n=1 Tax=Phaeobacter sp. B1627 TaxID=2583809 RepID=UPI0011184A53|nr:DUF2059 domain-containing protein [Phaeobacter sp. B1627]TNJ46865.1 DUF2059 domain-containing protein [Phaeobacter sp. B1627]